MKVETFQAMGAVPVKDGIVFSMERKNNEEASLLLYKKGSKDRKYRFLQQTRLEISSVSKQKK